ncbi:MAG TPA: NAD(P)/FAD-dependent oxidoreductase [Gemmatimonadaceae bacterium]|nr:NAD(P)/FAD-dependent oxidoreductase [Gemmatimonadaceae bacterium]
MTRARVVIIGGGFAGIAAAKRLKHAAVDVVVVDRTNHFVFQPLLYQVATGGLAPSDISVPIRWLLRSQRNTRVVLAEVTRIDLTRRVVELDGGKELEEFDYLILAAGARHSYFAHNDWETYAPGLKTLDDALTVRERFLMAFEDAERADDEETRAALQTLVVVGGGPTGVELAGMMSTIARTALPSDFRRTDPSKAHVILLEAGDRLLPAMPQDLSLHAKDDLQKLGVDVRLGSKVTTVTDEGVRYLGVDAGPTPIFIRSASVFWAAGNAAASLGAQVGGQLDRAGRVVVAPDLSVPEQPNVFVVGDMATLPYKPGRQVPWVCPAAIQEGRHAAENVLRTIAQQKRRPFNYRNKGDLATIGRHRAVADFGAFTVSGVLAWLLWVTVHIFYLAGFRNRLSVMLQWAWSYFTYQRGVRLIVSEHGRHPPQHALSTTR